jgi:predicted aminopeptidase
MVVYFNTIRPAGQEGDSARSAGKAAIFQTLEKDCQKLKTGLKGDGKTERWIGRTPLNNAELMPFAVYGDYVPAFLALLQRVDRNLPEFYAYCRALAALPKAQRHRRLSALLRDCPAPTRDVAIDAE